MADLRLHAARAPASSRSASPARPPFPQRWAVRGDELLEFGPVAGGSSLYLLKNNGALYAIKRRTGVVYWKKKLGHLAASSPAYRERRPLLHDPRGRQGLEQGPDRRLQRRVPARALVAHAAQPHGDLAARRRRHGLRRQRERDRLRASRADDGKLRWTYKASGAVKGGLAYDGGKLYFGDYSGHVQAIDARQRAQGLARRAAAAGAFGLGGGQFYATPSVAFGRVYLGNTNGSMYSFATGNGELAWRTRHRQLHLLLGGRRERPGRRADRLRRLLRRHALRARTRAAATSAGATAPRAGSPAASR